MINFEDFVGVLLTFLVGCVADERETKSLVSSVRFSSQPLLESWAVESFG